MRWSAFNTCKSNCVCSGGTILLLRSYFFCPFFCKSSNKKTRVSVEISGNRHFRVAILPYCILMHLTILHIKVQRNVSAVTLFHLDLLYVSQCALHNGKFILEILTTMLCIPLIAILLGYDCLIVRWKCSF